MVESPTFIKYVLIFSIIIAYLITTYRTLLDASAPFENCVESSSEERASCLKPFISPHDVLSLELWIRKDSEPGVNKRKHTNDFNSKEEWDLVDSCRYGLHISMSNSTTIFGGRGRRRGGGRAKKEDEEVGVTNSGSNCTILLPDSARIRSTAFKNPKKDRGLDAKFVLRQRPGWERSDVNETEAAVEALLPHDDVIIAEAKFKLTRYIERTSPSSTSSQRKQKQQVPYFKYWSQPIVLRIVSDYQLYVEPPYRGDGILLPMHHEFENERFVPYHKPLAYVDDAALRYSSQIELAPPPTSSSTNNNADDEQKQQPNKKPPIPIRIRVTVITPLRDILHRQLHMVLEIIESVLHESELDEIRYFLRDEHIYRFFLTQIISYIHLFLDYMAFRDEMAFYVGRTNRETGGVSFSSIWTRAMCSLIIFLYVWDVGNTSWFVLVSLGSGVMVDMYKVVKVWKPVWYTKREFPFVGVKGRRDREDELTVVETTTMKYDRVAMVHLSLILYPGIVGLSLYTWTHQHHQQTSHWYSWLISTLADCVYLFGFITLCPQLYINYKLKSISHMPWKVYVYKIFNTFVDDIFAFIIEMPLKHKIMTLRDDVVFAMFLVQAYMYRVDKSRPNEFGYVYEEKDSPEEHDTGAVERIDDKPSTSS